MRGRPNLWRRTATLERRRPIRSRWRTAWNLDAFSDEDLEALLPLSAKQAAATAAGHEPVWTPAERALLAELATKAGVGQ